MCYFHDNLLHATKYLMYVYLSVLTFHLQPINVMGLKVAHEGLGMY